MWRSNAGRDELVSSNSNTSFRLLSRSVNVPLQTNFVDQIDLQNSLEATAGQLKREFGKDGAKMQDALPGLLKRKGVTKLRFVSPFSNR